MYETHFACFQAQMAYLWYTCTFLNHWDAAHWKGGFVAVNCHIYYENIQKTIRIFDPFSIVKLNALINFDKWGVILELRKSSNTSNTKLQIDFTCKILTRPFWCAASQSDTYNVSVIQLKWSKRHTRAQYTMLIVLVVENKIFSAYLKKQWLNISCLL